MKFSPESLNWCSNRLTNDQEKYLFEIILHFFLIFGQKSNSNEPYFFVHSIIGLKMSKKNKKVGGSLLSNIFSFGVDYFFPY